MHRHSLMVVLTGKLLAVTGLAMTGNAAEEAEPAPVGQRADQQIAISVQLVEVNRTKLQMLGVDLLTPEDEGDEDASFRLSRLDKEAEQKLAKLLNLLSDQKLVRTLAAPTVTTMPGRQASFEVGENTEAQWRGQRLPYFIGTKLDVLPQVLEGGRIQVELDLRFSEPAPASRQTDDARPRYHVVSIEKTLETASGQMCVSNGHLRCQRQGVRYSVLLLVKSELVAAPPPGGPERVAESLDTKRE